MMNEILLIGSLIFIYGMALLGYKLFGKTGLYCISAAATILANIEVLIMIKAFGAEQTLGNVLFAVTFLITDILSECEGKKAADKAVYTSFFCLDILPRAQSELAALCSERKRLGIARNTDYLLKHAANDNRFTCSLRNKSAF